MPVFETLLLSVAALGLTAILAMRLEGLRRDLRRPSVILSLIAAAVLLSATSAIVVSSDHAGTGRVASHGWPKPFFFRFTSEFGEASQGLDLLFFVGNSLVYLGTLTLAWALMRTMRREKQAH